MFTFSEAISFVVDCESQDEVDSFWASRGASRLGIVHGLDRGVWKLPKGP